MLLLSVVPYLCDCECVYDQLINFGPSMSILWKVSSTEDKEFSPQSCISWTDATVPELWLIIGVSPYMIWRSNPGKTASVICNLAMHWRYSVWWWSLLFWLRTVTTVRTWAGALAWRWSASVYLHVQQLTIRCLRACVYWILLLPARLSYIPVCRSDIRILELLCSILSVWTCLWLGCVSLCA